MNAKLTNTALSLILPNKGILASDESIESANKSLHKAHIAPTEENRRRYRELFIKTPNIEDYISGIILYEETLKQEDSTGKPFYQTLSEKEINIGIKLDEGLYSIPNLNGEKATKGLDRLDERIDLYKSMQISFAKWRAVYSINSDENLPSQECIDLNSMLLTQYSSICIQNEILPIVEPEVLMDGTHSAEVCKTATTRVLTNLFDTLKRFKVDTSDVVLKMNMILPGKESTERLAAEIIAAHTMEVINTCVPLNIAGIVFLSGGQSAAQATENLNAIAKVNHKYKISFSFLRAVEGPALTLWEGDEKNLPKARNEFIARLKSNIAAQKGEYK